MTGNAVKAAAASGQIVRGIHLTFAAPTIIEILSVARFDFVYLDGEHGTFDWRDIEIGCITAERHGMTPIARVPDRTAGTITRFLDRGVLGIVAPHVETVDDAKEAIDATYFAPLGERSFGGGRPFFLAIDDKPAHIAERNRTVSLCLMIESQAGLDNAHKLAALDGVDYISFGMMDLAQSLGHAGNPTHPDVKRAVQEASERVRKAGKRIREDFMNFAWISDILLAGAKQLLDGGGSKK
jgi:2-keto-3-deoxy-L-rhamnonate aldolase RhmA